MTLPSQKVADPAAQQNFEWLGGLIYAGTGAPENRVPAPVGATYHRRDGGAGSSFYVKESGGAGKTGWVAK